MAEKTFAYYLADNAVIYPSTNALDTGKLNIEENIRDISTRITNRNYVLNEGDFTISATTVDGIPHIAITSGQCNIGGYHLVTTSSLYLGAPKEASASPYYVGLKLGKDKSGHVLGDVAEGGVTSLNGVWASYFTELEIVNDPDLLILGTVVWDGNNFTTVNPSNDLLTRFDADMVRVEINDPKHPGIEYLTLQELVFYLPDWYVSKLGDDIFGDLYFRLPGDLERYGIVGTLESDSSSKIIVKPVNSDDSAYRAILGANTTHPYLQLGTAAMIDYAANLGIYSPTGINITGNNGDVDILASKHAIISSSTKETELDIYNGLFNFSSNSIDDIAGFNLSGSSAVSMFLDDFVISHATGGLTTITNDGDIQFDSYVMLNRSANVNGTLSIDNDSYLRDSEWYFNGEHPVRINNNGIDIQLKNSRSIVHGFRAAGDIGYGTLTQAELELSANKSGFTPTIGFATPDGIRINLYKVSNDTRLRLSGSFTADGTITAQKVYNAVYNDIVEFMEKEDYNEVIEPGDIVYFTNSGKVTKYHEGINQTAIAGVVSSEETYGYALGGDGLEDNQKVPVALKGRVYVKTDNTGFVAGDLISVDACGCVYKGDINTHDFYTLGIATRPEKDGKVFMLIK